MTTLPPVLQERPVPMRESCGTLKDYWYAAALATEVTSKKPLGRVILEQPLVLYRLRSGAVACLEDRCAHRNAMLSQGDVFDDRIGCPYHGWTYDAEGRCVNVPSEGAGPPALECRVPRFPAREQDGLVWVWMGDGPPDKEPFRMPFWDAPGWGAYYMVTDFANDVTHLVENFMDVPHTTFVHRGWFRSPARRKVRAVVERTPDSVLVTYDQPKDSIGFSSLLLNPRGKPMTHTDHFYMPNNTRVDYEYGEGGNSFVITSTCTPRRPFDTLVFTLISYRFGAFNPVARRLLPWYTREVITQDVVIMRNQGGNLQRFGGEPKFNSTPADTLHLHIEALREHALAGGQGEPPPPRVDEMEFWI
jgi:phenylpropionate dioxygenase-like ring-hydroxylating dioxygenase large terminal subunit